MYWNTKTYSLLSLFTLLFAQSVRSAETIQVSLTDSIRPVTHCATGALYGVTETYPDNINELVAPLKPHVYCLPPSGGKDNQHEFGDAFIVADRLRGTTAKVQILFADHLPYWPYKWPGQKDWLDAMEGYMIKKRNSGLGNIHSYVIWNEPDGTWDEEKNGDFNTVLWKPTYDLFRKYDPQTMIVGPASSFYDRTRMKKFLTFCKKNDCLPDLLCWHQWGVGGFAKAVKDVRELEKELELPEIPLCINEYSRGSDWDERYFEGCPGYCVPFIAKFERYKVESATISWWWTDYPGRLGSLLTKDNETGGGWWLYKWYGEMTGYMASVTPPNDESDKVDAFVSVDKNRNYISCILGGNTIDDVNVVFDKLPHFLSTRINVKIERVTWEDKDLPVRSTDIISEEEITIKGKSFTVPVKVESNLYAYRIYITPVDVKQEPYNGTIATIPGTIEAEHYDVAGQGYSYYDNDDENRGDGKIRSDFVDIVKAGDGYALGYTEYGEWVEYTVNVEKTGDYDISAYVSDGYPLEGFQLYMDDRLLTDHYMIPQTCNDWSVYEEISIGTVSLLKGRHILKLQITGSYVNIDWLRFDPHQETGILDIDNSTLSSLKGALFFDLRGQQMNIEDLTPGKIYIAVKSNGETVKFIIKGSLDLKSF